MPGPFSRDRRSPDRPRPDVRPAEPVTVHFDDLDDLDDLDVLGMLHNARCPLLVERAWTGFRQEHGLRFDGARASAGVACNVVKELLTGYEAPFTRTGTCAVHLRLERLGSTRLTYGFRFCSADGATTYARGTRVQVRLDAGTLRPAPWSDGFRAAGRELLRAAG